MLQRAVRLCLERMNIVVVELDENYEKTRFDGVWRFSDAGVKKNIGIAPRYFGDVRDCESGKKPFLQLFSLWLFLVTELLFSAFPGGVIINDKDIYRLL